MNMVVHPVFRYVDLNEKEHFVLVLNVLSENGEEKVVEGVKMEMDGIGCLKEADTIAFPNTRGITRLKVSNGDAKQFKMVNATEVIVVVEKVIKENWFIAIGDMLLRLYMINEVPTHTRGYLNSFEYWDADFLDQSFEKRADLVQHYYNLLAVRESLQYELKSSTVDNAERTIHCLFDRRMRKHFNQYAEEENWQVEAEKSHPTEHKLVDDRTIVPLKMRCPVVSVCTFKLKSFLESIVGKKWLK